MFFFSLVCRGYIRKVSVQLIPKYFYAIAVLIVFHVANEKTRRKQDKNKTAYQERKIKTLLLLPIHLAHHRSAVARLLLRCCSVVAPMPHRYRTAIARLSHRYRSAVAPLSLRCRSVVALLSHRYCTGIAPLLLRCC